MGLANTWDMEVRMQGEHLKHHPSFIRLPYIFFASFSLLSVRLGEIRQFVRDWSHMGRAAFGRMGKL